MKLSPSKVDCFLGCKRLYKYRYVSRPFSPPENKWFLIGNTVHKALELFHGKLPSAKRAQCRKLMRACFKHAVEKYNIFAKEDSGLITRGESLSMRNMLRAYVDMITSLEILPDTVSLEQFFNVNMKVATIVGKADRVDKIDDGYKVIDYKTGQPLSKKDAKESVQLPTYGLWIKQEQGKDTTVYGEYIYVKHLGTKKGVDTFEITDEMIADAIEKYTRVEFNLRNGCKFTRNRDSKYCGICDFSEYCVKDKEN
jgi:CRISPR/Cas system-associated exonuclease Cas4 (RecB family)